jgi:hypothetical protein
MEAKENFRSLSVFSLDCPSTCACGKVQAGQAVLSVVELHKVS